MHDEQISRRYRAEGHWLPQTLPERFAAVCAASAGRDALLDAGRRITFGEAASFVERLAGHLATMGIGPGDVVSWQLPNWWEAAIVHHAALRVGALPNPLNMIFRARELRYVLAEATPSVLVVPASFRGFDYAALALSMHPIVPSLRSVVVARGSAPGATSLDDLLGTPAAPPPPAPSAAADPALLLYTSGTTSDPKGVLHSHETLAYEIRSLAVVHAVTPDDRYLGGSPVTHIAGLVYGLLMPFMLGTSTALLDQWSTPRAVEAIERDGATFQTGAPTFLATLAANVHAAPRGRFRLFSTGGASIDADMVREAERKLGCVVKRAYGSTEAPTLTATAFEDSPAVRLGTDGRAIGPAELRIVDGEIWARSPEIFLGYRNPALDTFTGDGWFRTGDLGEIDRTGSLRVTGRLKDIIIRGGENISAAEVEALLSAHPAVAEVAVIGMPDAVLGERACAFIVPKAGTSLTLADVTAFLDGLQIARQKFPERLELRPELPKTASGKVAKAVLRAELAS